MANEKNLKLTESELHARYWNYIIFYYPIAPVTPFFKEAVRFTIRFCTCRDKMMFFPLAYFTFYETVFRYAFIFIFNRLYAFNYFLGRGRLLFNRR